MKNRTIFPKSRLASKYRGSRGLTWKDRGKIAERSRKDRGKIADKSRNRRVWGRNMTQRDAARRNATQRDATRRSVTMRDDA